MPSDIRWVTLPLGCPLNPSKGVKKGSVEISFLPPPPLQLLCDDEFRQRLRRLRALLAVMLRPHPLAHLRQQLLPKRLFAQTPAAPNRFELLAFLRPSPFLYRKRAVNPMVPNLF